MSRVSRISALSLLFFSSVGVVYAAPFHPEGVLAADEMPTKVLTVEEIQNEPRLQEKRTVTVVGKPMEELLKQLESEGIVLTCSVTCQDQKVDLRLKDRPLREIMTALAELVPGNWQKRGENHYELVMDSEAVDKRRRWWLLFERGRVAGLQAYRDQALKSMRGGKPEGDFKDAELFDEMAARAGFFGALPSDLQKRIADNLNEKILFTPRGSGMITSSDDEVGVDMRLSELPPEAQTMIRNRVNGISLRQVDLGDPTIRFCNLGVSVSANVVSGSGNRAWSGQVFNMSVREPSLSDGMEVLAELEQRRLPEKVAKLGDRAPRLWQQLAAFQESRVWQNAAPAIPAPRHMRVPPPLRPEVMAIIAEALDLEYISDYYSKSGGAFTPDEEKSLRDYLSKLRSDLPSLNAAADESLNNHAKQFDVSWKRATSGVVLVRNNRWYRDDRLEVPAPFLRRNFPVFRAAMRAWSDGVAGWRKQTPTPTGLLSPPEHYRERLDFEADVNASLTMWQIANGLRWAVPEEYWTKPAPTEIVDGRSFRHTPTPLHMAADAILNRRLFLPFYRSLDGGGRGLLLRGQLPFAGLPLALRDDALALSSAGSLPEDMLGGATLGTDGGMRRLRLTPAKP
ncbi:MAG: hypothetical protein H8F28_07135 [Fibrella sp.]|nr:hypothetical protein [Armatimonadota bacterium]